ncbi:MAG TPA: hypothetical protein VLA04_00145 [Verrucomicrobiae bacterium]|nr:hypothetical protein [Verrucomicrobiae bacterium]
MPFLHTQLNGEDVIVVVTNEPSATEADIRQLIASAEPYLVQTMKELAQPIGEDLLDGLRKSEYWQMSKDKTTGRLYSLALLPHYDKGEEEVRVGIYAKLEIDTDTENGVELIQDHYTPGEDRAFYKAALRFT